VATQASGTLVTQAQMLRSLQGLRDCSLPQHLKGAKQLDAGSFGGVHATNCLTARPRVARHVHM
jgi:hypothetical protein